MIKNKKAKVHLSHLMGKVIGEIRINKPEQRTQHYECAAWYENSVTDVGGVYDLVLHENYFSPHNLYLFAKVPAKITTDYFQSLWGGAAIGKAYDIKKNTGKQAAPIGVCISVLEAVKRTGNSPSEHEHDIYLEPDTYQSFLNYYHAQLADELEYMSMLSDKYFVEGEGLSSLHFCGQNISTTTQIIEEIKRYKGYLEQSSDMFRKCLVENSSWRKHDTLQAG